MADEASCGTECGTAAPGSKARAKSTARQRGARRADSPISISLARYTEQRQNVNAIMYLGRLLGRSERIRRNDLWQCIRRSFGSEGAPTLVLVGRRWRTLLRSSPSFVLAQRATIDSALHGPRLLIGEAVRLQRLDAHLARSLAGTCAHFRKST